MAIDIEKMRTLLLDKREELLRDMEGLTEAHPEVVGPQEASEGSQEFEETAVDVIETQQEQEILGNDQALLNEVEAALKRIEDGTYGLCIVCGERIPEKRLLAIPWASRCIKDEEAFEQRNLDREEVYDDEEGDS
jgi:DnaK suppressor protein